MGTIIEKYGFLNTSVWNLGRNKPLDSFLKDDIPSRLSKRTHNSYLPNYPFSKFNSELARRTILLWSEPGETIYDPFLGRGTRGFVANSLKRNYIGVEISKGTFAEVTQIYQQLNSSRLCHTLPDDRCNLTLIEGDGCQKRGELADESIDLVFTCPPFWNLEKYESCEGQLSDCKTYKGYMSKINNCIKECRRILKADKFSIWVVADFRRGKYYCLHKDIIDAHLANGYLLWDIVINVLNSPFVSFKAAFNDKQKYTGKMHEYVLVFKKPEGKEENNYGFA